MKIREQDPLKQGLKHRRIIVLLVLSEIIREQDPLKQGLKLEKPGYGEARIFYS